MTPAAQLPFRIPAQRRPGRVRPYSLTAGRTRCGHPLPVEMFVATLDAPGPWDAGADGPSAPSGSRLPPEARAIVELCRRVRSVAEVSALLRIPLGVVRVLLSDLAEQGRIRVYGTAGGAGQQPDRALLERVLGGLRRL
ncbi:DUF742 domain-containing protein [Streptomyces sp. B1866]|uniref:DUF742 domain-containing protein n=1 Tax=Streptomyces sp. B1866 TaxID=3075431 RepID=UPI00288D4055|nr:DUF742 domain-containing protein [Streptomyces sp. B1866]MDT3399118.1 DUF742 domain-containing protein [Streptomyces sp. B1866]